LVLGWANKPINATEQNSKTTKGLFMVSGTIVNEFSYLKVKEFHSAKQIVSSDIYKHT